MRGILLVDKPSGMTSHDVVARVRKASGIRKIGHTGTLDPAATGLLILCIGPATRLSEFLTGMDKVYEGAMLLGTITDSYDLDGTVVETRRVPEFEDAALDEAIGQFRGDIQQIPPMVSAVKIGGERLYKKARKGEVVERPPRDVTVHEFVRTSRETNADGGEMVGFRVRCSSGTYVRSLCHDVGEVLGCGAALAVLRRTAVGRHSVTQAVALDDLRNEEDVAKYLMPIDDALDLPVAIVNPAGEEIVCTGGTLTTANLVEPQPKASDGSPWEWQNDAWIQLKTEHGRLLAVAKTARDSEEMGQNPIIRPKRVLTGRS